MTPQLHLVPPMKGWKAHPQHFDWPNMCKGNSICRGERNEGANCALLLRLMCQYLQRVHSRPNIHTLVPFLASLSDSLPQLCKQLQPSHLIDSRHPSALLLFAVTVAPPLVHLPGLSGSQRLTHILSTLCVHL